MRGGVWVLVVLAALAAAACGGPARAEGLPAELPRRVLWVPDRVDSLDFIDPRKVAVAYEAAGVRLSGGRAWPARRANPVFLPPGAALAAVLRLEVDPARPPRFDEAQIRAVVEAGLGLRRTPWPAWLVLDVADGDVPAGFAGAVLAELRAGWPDIPLTVVVPAAWCAAGGAAAGLGADEVAPALTPTVPGAAAATEALAAGREFALPACRGAAMVAAGDPLLPALADRRLYVTNRAAWMPPAVRALPAAP